MSFIIKGSSSKVGVIYVGKKEKNKFIVTTDTRRAKKWHYVSSAERYCKSINVFFDLFSEYEWTILNVETREETPVQIELAQIVDIDTVDENSIRCNY